MIRLIAAIDNQRGIADEHGIPWQGRIPSDGKYFSNMTGTGTVVMGYRTYEEFATPLHGRTNYVAARPTTPTLRPGFVAVPDLTQFLQQHANGLVWVIGGAAVFDVSLPLADELFLTQIESDFHATKFFPPFADDFVLTSNPERHVENGIAFQFEIWRRSAR